MSTLLRKGLLFILLIIVEVLSSHGQEASIKGRVADTVDMSARSFDISLLRIKDSLLLSSTATDKNGNFMLKGLPLGRFLLKISNPSFTTHWQAVELVSAAPLDVGELHPSPKADTLSAVTVVADYIPPRMKGDTLEYNTVYLKMKENASIEDMLKRLPGVVIDPDGSITVNGQKIKHLMIDGQDVFGDDPRIVSRNFDAKLIAKVQVIDKKSRVAEFTGVDDGQTSKALNLTLKAEAKKGYSGKLEAGASPQSYYNGNGNLASFKDNRQLVVMGIAANTGVTGLSNAADGSGLAINGNNDDVLNASAGGGIPRIIGSGLHYSDKWNDNEDQVTGNYQYGHFLTRPFSSNISIQTLPDSIYRQESQSHSINSQDQHSLGIEYKLNPDTLSAVNFLFTGQKGKGHNEFAATGASLFNDTLVNSNLRTINSDIKSNHFEGNIMWRLTDSKKKTSNLSIVAGIINDDNETSGFLFSANNYFKSDGRTLHTDTIDQYKAINSKTLLVNTYLNYTAPLWKDATIGLSYGFFLNNSKSSIFTYAKGGGKYENYIDSLSNQYNNRSIMQSFTVSLQTDNKSFTYKIATDIIRVDYRQNDLLKNSITDRKYLNLAPRINANYNFSPYKGIAFGYFGSMQQPTIQQLQPVQNNNDPLHIIIGNPSLRPSFSHYFGLIYHNLQPVVFNINLNHGFILNSISMRIYTDSLGRQVSQAVNVNGTHNTNIDLSVTRRLKSLDMDLGFTVNGSYNRGVGYLNQYLNRSDVYIAGIGIMVNKFVTEKYSLTLNSGINYWYARSSVNTSIRTHYWTQTNNYQFSLFLLKTIEISTNILYNWHTRLNKTDINNSTIYWNAYINKTFAKLRLSVRCQLNNILGQNSNILIGSLGNQTTEKSSNTIGRYWMLSAAYRFQKK